MSEKLPERARLRASDADRDAVIEVLRRHSAEGRLDLEELGERISRALSSKTYGELDQLTADLPSEAPAPIRPRRHLGRTALIGIELAVFNFFFLVVWAVGSHGGSFWPGWILLVSAVLFVRRACREQLRRERRRERQEHAAS